MNKADAIARQYSKYVVFQKVIDSLFFIDDGLGTER